MVANRLNIQTYHVSLEEILSLFSPIAIAWHVQGMFEKSEISPQFIVDFYPAAMKVVMQLAQYFV